MTDIKKIATGFGIFIIAIFVSLLGYVVLDALFPIVNAAGDSNAIGDGWEGTFWFVLIIIWIVGIFVLPGTFYYQGITEQDDIPKVIKGAMGILVFTIGMIASVKLWFMATAISDILSNYTAILVILFWIGLLFNWATCILVAPYYMVADARQG